MASQDDFAYFHMPLNFSTITFPKFQNRQKNEMSFQQHQRNLKNGEQNDK